MTTKTGTFFVVEVVNRQSQPETWIVTMVEREDIDWESRSVVNKWRAQVGVVNVEGGVGSSSRNGTGTTHEEAFWKLFEN